VPGIRREIRLVLEGERGLEPAARGDVPRRLSAKLVSEGAAVRMPIRNKECSYICVYIQVRASRL
jgi:hypothetical protein